MNENPLKTWRVVTLWLQITENGVPQKRLEVDVWMPPNTTQAEKAKLCENHASQMVKFMGAMDFKFGESTAIIQGQYKEQNNGNENHS